MILYSSFNSKKRSNYYTMVRTVGSTDENYQRRIVFIRQVIQANDDKNRQRRNEGLKELTLSDKELLRLLRRAGHYISQRQLSRDKVEIASNNSFVSDLAKTYSQTIEGCINGMEESMEFLKDTMNSEDIEEVTVMQGMDAKGKTYGTKTTKKIKTHKIQAAKIYFDCKAKKAELVSGNVLKVSAANWVKYSKSLETEVYQLKEQIRELKQKQVVAS